MSGDKRTGLPNAEPWGKVDVLGRPTQVDLVDWLQQQRPEAN
jgi:hypothetical protein